LTVSTAICISFGIADGVQAPAWRHGGKYRDQVGGRTPARGAIMPIATGSHTRPASPMASAGSQYQAWTTARRVIGEGKRL
jgi:hypothetical protein